MVSKGNRGIENFNISALPYITGAVVTIIIGTVSYVSGVSNKVLYMRMAISMLAFYSLGIYVKAVLLKIIREVEEKRKEEEERIQQEEKKKNEEKEQNTASHIDISTGNDDSFSPLVVSEVIKSKIDD